MTDTDNWQSAARKYLELSDAKRLQEISDREFLRREQEEASARAKKLYDEIVREISDLSTFMEGDGKFAMTLLKCSGKRIIFADHNDGGGCSTLYQLDGEGLHRSAQASGTWIAYTAKKLPEPRLVPLTPEHAVHAARACGRYELVSWLKIELDKIANDVLK